MAGEKHLWTDGYLAGADLSAKRYYAVKLDSNGAVVLAGAGESAVGILTVGEATGKMCTVVELGVSYAILGAAVAVGANLTPDAAGKLVTAGGTDAIIAVAKTAGHTGDIIPVNLVTRSTAGTTGISNAYAYLQFPVTLTAADNRDLVTGFTPGFAGKLVGLSYVAQVAATTAAKTASITMEIGTTAVTGGALSLTTANCGAIGAVVNAAAITGTNSFSASDSFSILAADTSVPFIEGSGTLVVKVEI